MESPYTDFVGNVWEEFPQLAEWHNLDESVLPMWDLEQFVEVGCCPAHISQSKY